MTALSALEPRRLSLPEELLCAPRLFNAVFLKTTFQSVTHFEIVRGSDWPSWAWDEIEELPNLTHVSLTADGIHMTEPRPIEVCMNILGYKKLRVLVVQKTSLVFPSDIDEIEEGFKLHAGFVDPRLIVIRRLDDLVKDWEAHINGQEDLWTHTEAMVDERRKIDRTTTI